MLELRTWRKSQGISQKALAAMLGVTPQAVWKWEHGDTPWTPIALLLGLLQKFPFLLKELEAARKKI